MLRMKNIVTFAAIACAGGGATAVATATASTARPAAPAKLKLTVTKTRLGDILTTGSGLIVYMFTKDKHDKNTCPASTGCAAQWPPLTGTLTLGPGVKSSLIGHIKDGSKSQITYNKHPLYGYIYNSTSVSYVGYFQFGGAWDAVSPSGAPVKYK